MSEVVVTPSLDVIDLQHAHEQYDNFVVIAFPMLCLQEFKERRQLPLNDTCASVFFAKTAHLKETDFLEIDRLILEMIGFKNNWIEKKDKNGNVKLDDNGNPKMEDTRKDFNNAIRCLRNMEGFKESNNFDDSDADFVIKGALLLPEKLIFLVRLAQDKTDKNCGFVSVCSNILLSWPTRRTAA